MNDVTTLDPAIQRRHNALGFCTKELCSALFVSGRTVAATVAADLDAICRLFAGGALDPREIAFTVDGPAASVTGSLADGTSRHATAAGSRGAVLVAEDRLPTSAGPAPIAAGDPRPWPLGDAPRAGTAYAAVRDAVRAHVAGTGARGVAVVHRGELVVQEFAGGFDARTPTRGWSTAKTLTALVVGWLAGRGLLDPAAPAPVPAWRQAGDQRRHISWLDLLGLRSGLSVRRFENGSDGMLTDADDYFAMYVRPVCVERMVARASVEARPGELFSYKSIDHLAVASALRTVVGDDPHAYLSEAVLPALGLRHSVLESDAEGTPMLCGAWYTTPADLARIGALVLGSDLLDPAWTDLMRAPAPRARLSGPRSLQQPYGVSLWLNTNDHLGVGAPRACYALGSLGQAVFVLPDDDLVIARTALEPRPRHADLLLSVRTAISESE